MRAPVILLLTGIALAACGTTRPTPVAVPLAAAPAPVEGYDWFYSMDGGQARLAYGVQASDDLRIGLDCAKASGRLDLVALAAKGAPSEIHIESGGDIERYPAASEPSELHDGVLLTARAPTDAPVFQRFRRLGWLAVWQDGKRQAYAPHTTSLPAIERFFAFCG